jgi:uncharacterized protein with PIN domain
MATVTLRFYAELNDFLVPERRQRDWVIEFVAPAPVRHLIERCGVPHTEVELIVRGGESIGLESPVGHGERIAVYPMFEAFDVRPLLQLRPRPLRVPRFLADAHLGTLAKRLRMLGFDTLWYNDLGDAALAELAGREHRILLTRDRQLLMRRSVTHGCYLRATAPRAQLAYLVEQLQLCAEMAPFSRCIVCNGCLAAAAPESIRTAVPPGVWVSHRSYWRCRECARVYWKGSHWAAMSRQIAGLCGESGPANGAVLLRCDTGANAKCEPNLSTQPCLTTSKRLPWCPED